MIKDDEMVRLNQAVFSIIEGIVSNISKNNVKQVTASVRIIMLI
jgi:hypothetical protein